jgi:hypothetical protein
MRGEEQDEVASTGAPGAAAPLMTSATRTVETVTTTAESSRHCRTSSSERPACGLVTGSGSVDCSGYSFSTRDDSALPRMIRSAVPRMSAELS